MKYSIEIFLFTAAACCTACMSCFLAKPYPFTPQDKAIVSAKDLVRPRPLRQ